MLLDKFYKPGDLLVSSLDKKTLFTIKEIYPNRAIIEKRDDKKSFVVGESGFRLFYQPTKEGF